MAVTRKVTISLPVAASDGSKHEVFYEPQDNGQIKVTDHKRQQLYYVNPTDLLELVVAVCGGTLLKLPDIQRALAAVAAQHD